MEYLLLKQPLKTDRFDEELHFSIDPELMTVARMIVPSNYASAAHFGSKRSDAFQALAHAAQTLRRIREGNIRHRTLLAQLRNSLMKDFDNYLHCLHLRSAYQPRTLESFISALIAVGCDQEVADSLRQYHARFCEAKSNDPDDDQPLPPLDLTDLYIKAGDKALFQDENLPLALQYYRLSILNWSEPESERISLGDSWYSKVLDYLHITRHLQYTSPFFFAIENDTLAAAFLGILERTDGKSTPREIVEITDAFFLSFHNYMDPFSRRRLEDLRDAFILAWAVKIHCLLDTLCALREERAALHTQLHADVLKSVLAMNVTGCPARPLWAYAANYQEKKTISEELLQFAYILDLIIKIRSALRVRASELEKDTAYYTSLDTLMYMLPPECKSELDFGKLSVMNIAYMNDPNEGKILRKFLSAESETALSAQRKSSWYPFVFTKCFTSRIDDLPMWEMYGNRAEGCCIIIDWPKTLSGVEEIPLYRICYLKKTPSGYSYVKANNPDIRKDTDFAAWLRDLQAACLSITEPEARSFLDDLLERIAYLFKDSNYHYEKEIRILYTFSESCDQFRETPGKFPKLFVSTDFPIHIKEIIIGPKFQDLSLRLPYIQQQLEKMCRVTRALRPQITLSEIEYR